MAKSAKIQQQCLKEKAAMLLNKKVSTIKKVDEREWNEQGVGATVYMKSGCMDWINIPLQYWIGEEID